MIHPCAVSAAQVAALLGLPVEDADQSMCLTHVCAPEQADSASIVFAADSRSLERALTTPAGLVLAPRSAVLGKRVLPTPDPRLAFAQVYAHWFAPRLPGFTHPLACVDSSAVVGEGCRLGPGVVLSAEVRLGPGCWLGPRVVVLPGTTLGANVRVQAGAVLGSDGFGYVRGPAGYLPFPQIGTLVVEDDVEIGANTTIDRGALGETRIGRGTKIDNLVHIAHNCTIGADVVIAAQTGIAGSTVIGDGAVIGGQVGLGDHVEIGPGVILGSQAGVLPHKRLHGAGQPFWGTPARPLRLFLRDLARLRRADG